jgi:hypothetical protein
VCLSKTCVYVCDAYEVVCVRLSKTRMQPRMHIHTSYAHDVFLCAFL